MPRPKGSKNLPPVPTVEHASTKCIKCGSTKRGPYKTSYSTKLSGQFRGQDFDEIFYRRTCCLDCGQWRIDKEYVLTGAKPCK